MSMRSPALWLVGLSLLPTGAAAAEGFIELAMGRSAPAQVAPTRPQPRAPDWANRADGSPLRSSFDEVRPEPAPAEPSIVSSVPDRASPTTTAREPDAASDARAEVLVPSRSAAASVPPVDDGRPAVDPLAAAVEARLADPKLAWPARLGKRERDAIAGWYKAGNHRGIWVKEGAWSARARAVQEVMGRAVEDGLDPAAYAAAALIPGPAAGATADLAEAELKLSALAVLYARDARGGRLEPARLSPMLTPKLELPSPESVLAALVSGDEPGTALAGYQPSYPGYRALRAKLAELRSGRPSATLAGRRIVAGLGDGDGLAATRASGTERLEADIVANMERWRWLPAIVAPRYLAVNLPEFQLRLIEGGHVSHQTRVIVGKPETPTPIVSGLMDQAVVNPSWYIPPSIMKNEILPGLARDPDYAARRGYEVVRRGGAVTVRQPPGERNALGFIKFLFPNNHAVYLHDTPNRSLFGSARRAFSHGCVRVDQPFRFADAVLGETWTEDRLRKLIGRGERPIPLADKLPVHFVYFTVEVDALGEVRTFEDLYGYNRRIRAALGLGG